jgi:hypothetical protein
MLQRVQIQRMEFLLAFRVADFLIEADFGFVAEPLALQQRVHQFLRLFGGKIFLPEFVMRDQGRKIRAHMMPHVHTDQIYQPECGCFWATHQRSSKSVHFIHGVFVFHDEVHCERARAERHTIADEVRRILAQHNALAQTILAKV